MHSFLVCQAHGQAFTMIFLRQRRLSTVKIPPCKTNHPGGAFNFHTQKKGLMEGEILEEAEKKEATKKTPSLDAVQTLQSSPSAGTQT